MSSPDPALERRREQEFYRYYEPLAASDALKPAYVDLYDPAAAAKHRPSLAPDEILTSLCHLGALQFGAARCMLFFFDQDSVYILAEATNRLFTGDQDPAHDAGSLWLGSAVIPRGLSVCEHTINLPTGNEGPDQDSSNAADVHIINDLREDVRFCDRPFVTAGPLARFYAGVPITTPRGVRIGVYCVLDDRPRDGISNANTAFLKHMANVVMTHLENRRVNADIGRGASMLKGLGTLVKSKPEQAQTRIGGRQENKPASKGAAAAFVDDPMTTPTSEEQNPFFASGSSVQDSTESPPSLHRKAMSIATAKQSSTDKIQVRSPSTPQGHVARRLEFFSEGEIAHSFQKAADIIADAMDVDGVAFLDAVPRAYRARVDINRGGQRDRLTDDGASGLDTESTTDDDQHGEARDSAVEESVQCSLLGFASRTKGTKGEQNPVKMTEKFLQTLSQRHPRGDVWLYVGSEGLARVQPDTVDSTHLAHSSRPSGRKRSARKTAREATSLQQLLPGARSVCFVPLWDPLRERWYAGAMTWSYSRHRILRADSELNYMRAFCNVLMGEIVRLESKREDKAKSALISSVSHELRSPLHGILGSIDLLEGRKDSQDRMLIQQMEKCGTTLLAVVDHLLDFAEINHHTSLATKWRNKGQHRGIRREQQTVALSGVTEDVVDTVYYSHCLDIERQKREVTLILDLLLSTRYRCRLTVGAWKRLLTNVVGNALKYTVEGHVRVTLDVTPGNGANSTATLTISDTGVGMSADFLQNHLFRPFSQEDPLAVGTGLGMSIVSQLVREANGDIQVQSEKHVGTTTTITIPLIDASSNDIEPENQKDGVWRSPEWNVRMGFPSSALLSRSEKPSQREQLQRSVERTYQSIGVEICSPETANVWTILESDCDALKQRLDADSDQHTPPCVVLCSNMRTLLQHRAAISERQQACHLEFVLQPYGPQRMQAAIRACAAKSGLSGPSEACTSSHDESTPSPQTQTAGSSIRKRMTRRLKSTDRLESTPAILTKAKQEDPSSDSDSDPSYRLGPRRTQTADDAQEIVQPADHSKKAHLLLVDDNPINLKLLVAYASRNKHSYVTATNGQEAVEAYQQASGGSKATRPDVVFLDLNMPIMDGFEAACNIRKHERSMELPATTIVAVTALGDAETQQKAHSSGIDRFMKKPARNRDLDSMLDSIAKAEVTSTTT